MQRCILETVAESEVERRLGYQLHERRAADGRDVSYRNGYRQRRVQLPGLSITIRIPCLREGGFVPGLLVRNERALADVTEWVYEALLCGISRAELTRLMERMTGFVPSPSVLRRVEEALDAEVKSFKQRRLSDKYMYLFLDAAWVKDLVGATTGRVCVLMAVGVTDDGRKECLGFERVRRETTEAWRGFLTRLAGRGLDLSSLELVISDEHKGLLSAVPEVLGDVAHQLCWAHRVRNIRSAVAPTHRAAVIEGLRAIYRAKNLHEASAALNRFVSAWSALYPSVTKKLAEDAGYLLAFLRFDPIHWEYVRTSNPIERVFREVRRWRRGCGAFANPHACDRVFYKVSRLLNERWAKRDLWFERKRRTVRLVPLTSSGPSQQAGGHLM